MRAYGTLRLVNGATGGQSPWWQIDCVPHVAIRAKRVFEQAAKGRAGNLILTDTPETCRDLEWFLERYPMDLSTDDRRHLRRRARQHRDAVAAIDDLLAGRSPAPSFDLALPPREYQRVAAAIALRQRQLLLADELGLGKTVSAICLLAAPGTLPALVVTLAGVMPKQWERELNRFAPALRTHVVRSGRPYPMAAQADLPGIAAGGVPDVVIINYHKLAGWVDALAGRVRTVVFDEAQELRRVDSQKWDAALSIAQRAEYRIGLSATPIFNYGSEFWNVLRVIAPGTLPARDEFLREWCEAVGSRGDARTRDPVALGSYLREQGFMLRRTRTDVGRELPPLSRIPMPIDADHGALDKVGNAAAELARIILAQSGTTKRGERWQASEELSNLLRQATGIAKAPFVAAFVRMLVESGERVLLYGWHRAVYDLWLAQLADLRPAMFTGSESAPQKAESLRRFLGGETPVLIMSLRAGQGVDGIQAACKTVVFGELDWAYGVHAQGEGRVYRDGQAHPVFAYYPIAEVGSDPIVADILGVKRMQSDGVLDPGAAPVERLEIDPDHVKRLAADYLRRHRVA